MAGIPKGVALAGLALLAASGVSLFMGVDLALGLGVAAEEVIPGSPRVSVKGGALLVSTSLILLMAAYGVLSGSRWGRPSGALSLLALSTYLVLVREIWGWSLPATGALSLLALYLLLSRESALYFRGGEWREETVFPSPLPAGAGSEGEPGEVLVEGVELVEE